MNTYLRTLIITYGRVPAGLRKDTAMAAIEEYCDSRESQQYSIVEYAAKTGQHPKAVLRMIHRGELQAKKFGRTWVIIT